MNKSKPQRAKTRKQGKSSKPRKSKRNQPSLSARFKAYLRFWLLGKRLFFLLSGALTFIALILSFSPRLSIEYQPPLDALDALTSPFTLKNEGYLPIGSLEIFMYVVEANFSAGSRLSNSRISNTSQFVGSLGAGDSRTITFESIETSTSGSAVPKLASARISVVASFRYLLWPFNIYKAFPFHTIADDKGTIRWLPGVGLGG